MIVLIVVVVTRVLKLTAGQLQLLLVNSCCAQLVFQALYIPCHTLCNSITSILVVLPVSSCEALLSILYTQQQCEQY